MAIERYILNCPKCGDELVPFYPAKALEDLLQGRSLDFLQGETRGKPDFWFCDHCHLEYRETKAGKLGKGTPQHWPKRA